MELPYQLTAARLLLPFFILRWPLVGLLLCSALDAYDWQLFPFTDEASYAFYQRWDKTLDLYYWLFALATVFRWKDRIARRLVVGLFVYRLVGMGLFLLIGWRPLLFFFPNLFENLILFYLLFVRFSGQTKLFTSQKTLVVVLSSVALPKFIHEFYMHFLVKQPWELYDLAGKISLTGTVQEYANYFVWGMLLYSITLVALGYYVQKRRL